MLKINETKKENVGAGPVSAHTLKTRRNNGITLIALIITIIVMLILVAVTITVAVNGGLFEYAGRAGRETNEAIEKEQALASGDIIEYYLNRKDAVVALKAYSEELLNETGVLTENTKYEDGYNIAVIPKGFKVSDVSSEQTIANGLVIEDEEGNQFVWIPVKDGTFERTGWSIDNMTSDEFIAKMNNGEYTDDELITKLATIYVTGGNYAGYSTLEEALVGYGIIDDVSDNYDISALKTLINDSGYFSGNVESIEDIKDELTNICTLRAEYTENAGNDPTGEYANMVASVNKYGGFYIGRYEAGTDNIRTNKSGTTDVVVQKGAYPYNYVCWGKTMTDYESEYTWTSGSNTYNVGHGAAYLSKNMYTDENTYGVNSTLCYGVQWDATLRFIKDKVDVTNSTTWGNYGNHRFTFSGKYSNNNGSTWSDEVTNETKPGGNGDDYNAWLLTTGASETNKAKNIYDLAGNVWEWTMEASSSANRVNRGGFYNYYGGSDPASSRYDCYLTDSYYRIGFRPALYITNE